MILYEYASCYSLWDLFDFGRRYICEGVIFLDTILEALRKVLGEPDFYKQLTSSSNYTWDYAAMIEYFVGAVILCIVVSSVFRILGKLVSR